jgi:hypothetical protein
MDLRETSSSGVKLVYSYQNMDQWQELGNTVINISVPQKSGELLQ